MTAGLERFLAAQSPLFATAMAELARGRKESHWMWFIFPQARSLGRSPKAEFYGVASLAEARDYLSHPLLGERLRRAARTATASPALSLPALFGSTDALKFRSSMTLFAAVSSDARVFDAALARWNLTADDVTLDLAKAAHTGADRL